MQKVQLHGPKYAIKFRSVKLNCSSDTVPEGNTAEFLINGKSVNNVRLHQTKCFRTVDVIECVPGVCQCSGDGRTFVFYYYPNKTGKYDFSCKMKFSSIIPNQGHFVTNNKVTNIIEPTPLIKTDKHDFSFNLTCSVGFIDIITVFKWSCDNEAIMSESFHNASTSWSVVRLDISKKKTTTLCVCNVSLPTLNFTGSAAIQLKYRGRPHLLQNEVVYIGNDVVFSLTFYSSEESNIITWYRQWIRLVNSTEQVQTTKQTTLNVLVRGKNVSVEGFKSSLLLRNAKEHLLYNVKICVKNHYGISCHRYFESKVNSYSTDSTTNPVYYSADSQQNNTYQPISADREEAHAYETPIVVYEHLSEERPLHEYNIPSRYEEPQNAMDDVHSFDSRGSYEKVVFGLQ
ncbi:unnamed protein product [Mytilus coruscus]|uniref:Uncharacterized protein n=1 Tax=Mytilus coruscus TaxID=42192 RepID=A0A6J8EIL4_MYTCO|nr:unnamed protein product [Mytilus coruscus]